ncbi:hypothetical protein GCM10022221_57790 [Actinocorallia aurea]
MDIWAQLLPASPDVLTALLAEQGTMTFAEGDPASPNALAPGKRPRITPHATEPRTVELEAPLYDALHEALEARGYTVRRLARWDRELDGVGIVRTLPDGTVQAGADPHESTTAFVR